MFIDWIITPQTKKYEKQAKEIRVKAGLAKGFYMVHTASFFAEITTMSTNPFTAIRNALKITELFNTFRRIKYPSGGYAGPPVDHLMDANAHLNTASEFVFNHNDKIKHHFKK